MVAQHGTQLVAAQHHRLPAFAFEQQPAALLRFAVVAVPDEVKDVDLSLAQAALQAAESGPLQALDVHQAARLQRLQGLIKVLPLFFDIQVAQRVGDHHQHVERRLHRKHRLFIGQFDIAHDGGLDRA